VLLKCNGNIFRETDADKAAGSNCIAVMNLAHGLGGTDDLAMFVRQLLLVYWKWHAPYRGMNSCLEIGLTICRMNHTKRNPALYVGWRTVDRNRHGYDGHSRNE
jgi:hypothetical protein